MKKDKLLNDVFARFDELNESDTVIGIKNLTKDYGKGRGVFDINLDIKKGETVGYVGTNGSGKTTTIRHIMGFLKPQKGAVGVLDMDAWKNACEIKRFIGYIPGEISYPGVPTGDDFLKIQAEFYHLKNQDYMKDLIARLNLDTSANLKRMSKGMKQKTAIVSALMANPPVLILDEPSTGLDPLMRDIFIQIIREEKQKGKTIFMSSQLFDEVEAVCDRVVLIKDGKIIDVNSMRSIKHNGIHTYKIEFVSASEFKRASNILIRGGFNTGTSVGNTAVVDAEEGEGTKTLFNILSGTQVKDVSEIKYNFENYFKNSFKVSEDKNGNK